MNYSKHKLILEAFRVSDLVAFILAGVIAAWLAHAQLAEATFYHFLSLRFSIPNLAGYLSLAFIWLLIFDKAKLYTSMKPRHSLLEESVLICWATGVATLVYALLGPVLDISLFSPIFLAVFWPASAVLTLVLRKSLQRMLKLIHVGDNNQRHILIVGTDDTAASYAQLIADNKYFGFCFLGYLGGAVQAVVPENEILADIPDYKRILDEQVIDEIVITLPLHEFTVDLEHMIEYASAQGIMVRLPMSKLFNSWFGANAWKLRAERVARPGGSSSLDLVLSSGHQVGWRFITKRVLDFCAASLLLLLLSPVMVAAAVAIQRESKGGVFFVQERYGYNGRVFRLYKFRTMVQNADDLQDQLRAQNEMDGAAFKIRNDPRITPVGRFLRKTSIDELPQLLNVIKGEMSLVGPRPLPLKDYERFQEIHHMRRLSVLPGITCTWQAGGRNDVSFEEWMKLDMDYIDNWSLQMDLLILLKTVPAVLFGRGAS